MFTTLLNYKPFQMHRYAAIKDIIFINYIYIITLLNHCTIILYKLQYLSTFLTSEMIYNKSELYKFLSISHRYDRVLSLKYFFM